MGSSLPPAGRADDLEFFEGVGLLIQEEARVRKNLPE